MEKHYTLKDPDLLQSMESGTLDSGLFSHEAHLRWGWLLLEEYGLVEGIERATVQLQAYTRKLGAADKYNETVTVAAMKAIQHFRLKVCADNFQEFIEKAPRLKTEFKALMDAHYSTNIFTSAAARKEYINPDKLSFD